MALDGGTQGYRGFDMIASRQEIKENDRVYPAFTKAPTKLGR